MNKKIPIEVKKESWIIVLLALNNYEPIKGFIRLHYLFFISEIIGFSYEYGYLGPYSHEIEKYVFDLQRSGIIKTIISGKDRVYFLTDIGKSIAIRLIRKISNNKIILNKVLVMNGKEILKELEKLKKAFNNRPLLYLLYKCTLKFSNEWPVFIKKPTLGEKIFINESARVIESILRRFKALGYI